MYRKRIDFKPGDDQKEVKLLFHIALTWNLPKDLHLLLAWFRSRQFLTCLYFKAIAYFLSNTLLEHAKRHACAAWGIYTVIRRCNTLLRQWHHRFKWEKWLKACPNCYAWKRSYGWLFRAIRLLLWTNIQMASTSFSWSIFCRDLLLSLIFFNLTIN